LKLLIVAIDYPPNSGGIATYGLQLANALSAEHDVTVFASGMDQDGDREQAFTTIRSASCSVFRHLQFAWKLLRLLDNGQFDAVLHTTWPTALIGYLFLKNHHPPYFISAHASEILDDRTSWRRTIKGTLKALKISMLRQAAGVFPVSNYTAELLKAMGVEESTIQVINNGVDPDQFHSVKRSGFHSPPRLLTVARLDKHKGHDVVLKVMSKLKKKGISLSYQIVGKGDEEEHLKSLASQLDITDSVDFKGFVSESERAQIYANSDIFIMLSREIKGRLDLIEGFGISFLEAGAAALPVIAGKSGGVSDAVRDGVTGYLIDPEDEGRVEAVLTKMIENENETIQMGRNGRTWIEEEMGWQHVASRVTAAIQKMGSDK